MPASDADRGLSRERTTLAWQRTALGIAAGAAVMGRLTFDDLGAPALASLGAALVLSGWVLLESRLRPQRATRGGRAASWLAIAVVLMACTELAALVGGITG